MIAGVMLIVLSPLLVLIAVLIKVDSRGPVLFRQERVGKDFKLFTLLKFRTMISRAHHQGLLTVAGDTRITKVGAMLRRFKFDELPQIANVLRGEMQWVGSRPEVPRYVALFRDQYAKLLDQPPGITDPATLLFHHEDQLLKGRDPEKVYISSVLPEKLRLSVEYARSRNVRSDIGIVLATLTKLHLRSNSDMLKHHDGLNGISDKRDSGGVCRAENSFEAHRP